MQTRLEAHCISHDKANPRSRASALFRGDTGSFSEAVSPGRFVARGFEGPMSDGQDNVSLN